MEGAQLMFYNIIKQKREWKNEQICDTRNVIQLRETSIKRDKT